MRKLRVLAVMAAGATGVLVPGLARAHFILMAPQNWAQQDASGLPEKSAPCGQAETPAAVPTNAVTTFRPGQTITVMIQEAVFHPGWYKAVLSQNGMSGLPPDPMVTPSSPAPGDACGTATAATNMIVGLAPNKAPQLPVLVDGALFHTGPLSGQQPFNVTLPSNVTCTNCVLQIVEFMSNHGLNVPGGCFYHHCANIAIQGAPVDGGTGGGTDAGTDSKTGTGSGGATGAGGATVTGTGGSTAGVGGTSGGTAGTSGGTAGTSGGTAGTSGGTAGTSGGTAGSSGTGTGGSTSGSSGGGGCSVASGTRENVAGLAGLLLAIFVIRSRRHGQGRRRS